MHSRSYGFFFKVNDCWAAGHVENVILLKNQLKHVFVISENGDKFKESVMLLPGFSFILAREGLKHP